MGDDLGALLDRASAEGKPRRVLCALRELCLEYDRARTDEQHALQEACRTDAGMRERLVAYVFDAARMLQATHEPAWLRSGLAVASIIGTGVCRGPLKVALADLLAAAESAGFDTRRALQVPAWASPASSGERDLVPIASGRFVGAGEDPMPDEPLSAALDVFSSEDSAEARSLDRIREFIARRKQPFDRTIAEGHLTASAVVISRDARAVLLVRHRKLAMWLQPGGHAEPQEHSGEAIALREAREEAGLSDLEVHPLAPRPFDLDVHDLPARRSEPAHQHFDLRYLVLASQVEAPRGQAGEVLDARWFSWDQLPALGLDAGLTRALGKARSWMGDLEGA